MQGVMSDKTFHLKWNNHLQNLSQLFTTIYSSSALADVTLSCRDGTLKAHKLVLSACSPYFEQIFKDNPCQHPIVILKGIPFSEINLLVEFMYKGSVDVQELDLQSLMHTASELEIRGLAYEARDNAAQLLNVNLEYPAYTQAAQVSIPTTQQQQSFQQARTDVERLKQIHMYQQSMMRAEEIRRRRREDAPGTHTHAAVNNILAAAAREMEEARRNSERSVASIQTEQDASLLCTTEVKREPEEERPKKRVSIMSPDDDKLRAKKKAMTVRFQDDSKTDERPNKITSPGVQTNESSKNDSDAKPGGIKVVQLAVLQKQATPPQNNDHDDSDEKAKTGVEDDEETDSSGSISDSAANDSQDGNRPHVCDVCDVRFQRSSHLSRHRLTHTGERPFTCGGCGRSFARSDKLRMHTKICEREDPTVDLNESASTTKRENNSEVMSGMVRTTHRESGHLVFTASGDVMLPPRTNPVVLNSTLDPVRNEIQPSDLLEPPRRGRGRPRKTPLPLLPKIKKRRGRPPKTSLGMEYNTVVLNSTLDPVDEIQPSDLLKPRRRPGRPRKTSLYLQNKTEAENVAHHETPPKTTLGMEYNTVVLNSTLDPVKDETQPSDLLKPRRRPGRPRKTSLYLLNKTEAENVAHRETPPKISLDMEHAVLTSGAVNATSSAGGCNVLVSGAGGAGGAGGGGGGAGGGAGGGGASAAHQALLLKRRRGRPPKNFFQPRLGSELTDLPMQYGLFNEVNKFYRRPNENYNASNLPFGDFSYLTEMMYNPLSYSYGVANVDPDRNDADQSATTETSHDRTIDLSDSSSDEDDGQRVESEDNVPSVAMETQIMTVGDCQIVKLPPSSDDKEEKTEPPQEMTIVPASTPSSVTITPITTVGDCTIRPVENT